MHMTSEIYISMHGIFAQSESESLSGNVKWGKQKSAEKGNVAISYREGFILCYPSKQKASRQGGFFAW